MISHEDYILVVNLGTTGLTFEDVALAYKAPSSVSFESIDFEEEDFSEAQFGFYNINVSKDLICETGTYLFKLDGYELEIFEEREALPKPLSSSPAPDICIVTGNVRLISGGVDSFENVTVTARPVKLPANYDGTLTLSNRVTARTDFDGFFSIPVIRGAEVRFEIKDAGIRFQAIVPDEDTIRLDELIP